MEKEKEKEKIVTGAVDFSECPSGGNRCKCAKCAKCGNWKHTAVHGPLIYGLPGSKPWDHEFVEKRRKEK